MRTSYLAIITAVSFAIPAHAAGPADCDALCQDYKAAHPTQPKATTIPLVCIRFKQDETDNVVMTLYGANEELVREYAKTAAADDTFCIGAQWLTRSAKIQLCNGVRTEILLPKHIAILRASGMPAGSYACLLGSGQCDQLVKVVP